MKKLFSIAFSLCSCISIIQAIDYVQVAGETGSDKPAEGPSLPGGADSWAGPADSWAVMVRNAPGPTGGCPDPNPSTEGMPHGLVLHVSQPNGPDRTFPEDSGPTGLGFEYYMALTNDHYAGPNV